MIDWISGFLPCEHIPLETGCVVSVNPDGSVEWSAPKRQKVTGSFESSIMVSSHDAAGQGKASHLYFSGNPSKFLQGHNIFGSDDLQSLMLDTYKEVCHFLDIEPTLSDLKDVEQGNYKLTRVDVNYSYELPSRSDVLAWIRAAELKSKTRHGRPSSKGGTLYWGKSSRRWSLKAYSKGEEIEKHVLPLDLLETPLPKWADNKLRIELTLRSKQLDELQLNKASYWAKDMATTIFKDYIARLNMTEQIKLSDEKLMQLPQRLRSTYVLWKDGHDLCSTLCKTTYYRHRKQLQEIGINIDLVEEKRAPNNVIPLLRVLEAKPSNIPSWAFDLNLIHHSA